MRPEDNVCEAYPDLDLAELLYEIEDEFGIKIPEEDDEDRWTGRSMRSSGTLPCSGIQRHDVEG